MEQAVMTWIHLVSAAVWVGGSLFIGAVLTPILKKMSISLEERIQMMVKVGRQFNKIAVQIKLSYFVQLKKRYQEPNT